MSRTTASLLLAIRRLLLLGGAECHAGHVRPSTGGVRLIRYALTEALMQRSFGYAVCPAPCQTSTINSIYYAQETRMYAMMAAVGALPSASRSGIGVRSASQTSQV